jgi:hypothetical protein
LEGAGAMLKPKTHFEQVPLEVVKKIAKKEIKQEKTTEQTKAQVRPEEEG